MVNRTAPSATGLRKPLRASTKASSEPSALRAFSHNRAAVIAAAIAATALAALAMWVAMRWLPEALDQWPVQQVVFVGQIAEVDGADLEALAQGLRTRNASMFKLDLDRLRSVVMQLGWVRSAEVRRRFPHTIEIAIKEHRAVALWQPLVVPEEVSLPGVQTMVNSYGELFVAALDATRSAALPRLSGPADAAPEVLAKYVALQAPLELIGRVPQTLILSERRAWRTTLDNGTQLALGRHDADARVARFVRAVGANPALQSAALRIDLRYPNGLAIDDGAAPVKAPPKPRRT